MKLKRLFVKHLLPLFSITVYPFFTISITKTYHVYQIGNNNALDSERVKTVNEVEKESTQKSAIVPEQFSFIDKDLPVN